jgi:hypothetical protein
MDIGCQLPMQGPVATREAVVTFAREAERHRMASLWVSDHVIFPYTSAGYPGGRFPHPPDKPYLEPVALLAVYAFADPEAAVAEVKAEALIKPTGRIYRQDYVLFLRAGGAKIAFLREYFDPARAAKALDTPILGLES